MNAVFLKDDGELSIVPVTFQNIGQVKEGDRYLPYIYDEWGEGFLLRALRNLEHKRCRYGKAHELSITFEDSELGHQGSTISVVTMRGKSFKSDRLAEAMLEAFLEFNEVQRSEDQRHDEALATAVAFVQRGQEGAARAAVDSMTR